MSETKSERIQRDTALIDQLLAAYADLLLQVEQNPLFFLLALGRITRIGIAINGRLGPNKDRFKSVCCQFVTRENRVFRLGTAVC